MATLYAVHAGSYRPEICGTLEEAKDTARALDFSKYGSPAPTVEEIDAKLPNDSGIRTVYDIVDADFGGYSVGYYPASIGPGTHTDTVGVGPFCAECAREMFPQMEEDETFWAEPEYESAFGENCENCQKSLCEPHCQLCGDVREEDESRDWYTDDSHGYVCPRCMATGRYNADHGTECRAGFDPHPHTARIVAKRLAPGVYDVRAWEYDPVPGPPPYVSRHLLGGLFYAPSCGRRVAEVYDTYRAIAAR